MSFFNKIFGGDDSHNLLSFWKEIVSEDDLQKAVNNSFDKKVVIFKHSTRCFISKMVLKKFEKEVMNSDKVAEYYFLDLIAHRDLSNKIADDFEVVHQSPQMIILENGKVLNNASHQSISVHLI